MNNKRYVQLVLNKVVNVITNPNFDTDTAWSKGTGWTIANGKATHAAGTGSNLSQSIATFISQAGITYNTKFVVTDCTAGSVYIQISGGGGGTGTSRTANGTYIQDISAGATVVGSLYFVASADFNGSISSVYANLTTNEILNVDARNGVIANKYSGNTTTEIIPEASSVFNTDGTAYWVSVRGTLTWNPLGYATYTSTDGSVGGGNYLVKSSPLTVGKRYRVNIMAKSNTSTQTLTGFLGVIGGTLIIFDKALSSSWQLLSAEAVCAGDGQIRIFSGTLPLGETIDIKLLSVKEVIPSITNTAVTVQKAGGISAMDFNGSGARLDMGSYDTLIGDLTLITWINPKNALTGITAPRILDNGKMLWYLQSTFPSSVNFTSNDSTFLSSASNILPSGAWSLIVITRTSTGITNFYVNTALSGTADRTSGTPVAGTSNITIGTTPGGTDQRLHGQISQLRIINGILSTAEISNLYEAERRWFVV